MSDNPLPSPTPPAPTDLIACPECDRLQWAVPLGRCGAALCHRCGAELYRHRENGLERTLAFTLAGLILFVPTNLLPFLGMEMNGIHQQVNLASGAVDLWRNGYWLLGPLVLMVGTVAPLLRLAGLAYLLLPLARARRPWPFAVTVARWEQHLSTWAMLEVYLIAVLVALVKLAAMASVSLGSAFWAFCAVILCMAAASMALEPRELWQRLAPRPPLPPLPPGVVDADHAGLVACHCCGALASAATRACPRCDSTLYRRRPGGAGRAWALLLAAAILYVPANIYPVMTVVSFGSRVSDTILSGVVHLAEADMWPLAVVVFFASILVPVLKMLGLAALLLAARRDQPWRPTQHARLYRLIEWVGRWSMVDIFVVALLAALVRMGNIATVEPGAGATAFGAVVVLTMLAALAFDPRTIWDAEGQPDERS